MKFYVTRQLQYSPKIRPIDEADQDNKGWFVELHSLSALIELAEKYQTLILEVDHAKGETRIEIFDDWSDQA